MSVKSDLKKDGIEVVERLGTLKINSIAKKIASGLCKTFKDYGLNENELFIKLSRLDMYTAKMPEGMAEANYYYKNCSIYFNEHISEDDLAEFAVHECIHYLQEVKDKKNYLLKMGLCDYTEFKIYGLALNEASVQLMASKVNNIPKEYVKYFGIGFETISPSYYPLECCLVNQLAYITGEDVLFKSTLNSDDNFKNKFSELTSKKTFMEIQKSLDDILLAEEDIVKLNNKIAQFEDGNKKIDGIIKNIDRLKENIKLTFLRTQNLIVSSYFDAEFKRISNLEQLENYRKKLSEMRNYLGFSDGYMFFDNYYVEKMSQLEHKNNVLENGGTETAMEKETRNKRTLARLFESIKKLLTGNREKEKVDM